MNYSELYGIGRQILSDAGISEAALDARLLLEFITGSDHNTLLAHPDKAVGEKDVAVYRMLLEKRALHTPLYHLTGSCEFMGLEFRVGDKVLIPRQDSECLVEEAMKYVQDSSDILDLCTGSGCLLLSLMHYKNECWGTGVDISEDAVALAWHNGRRLEAGGNLNGGSVRFVAGDLYDALPADSKYDVIISNPPYIRTADIETLMPEVRDHEPHIALDGGDDGLAFYRRIAARAPAHLTKEGMIFLEIGYDQADDVTAILSGAGFTGIQVVKDYAGNDRVITARKI